MRESLRSGSVSFSAIRALSFCLFLSAAVFAQHTAAAPVITTGPFTEAMERRAREADLRAVSLMDKNKPADPRIDQALLDQMNDDFKQIQIVRLNMVKDIANHKPFEYKRLSNDAGEIKKRSIRLRSSLALFEEKERKRQDSKKTEYEKDAIQDAASDLCLEISRFTGNPMFAPGGVYNARYAGEADEALDKVISLSTDIKNSADRLRRDE